MKTIGLYAIYDKLAAALVGGIHLHRHEATAVRFFTDVAHLPNSQIALHPADHALVRLGELDETGLQLTPAFSIILEGSTWAASLPQEKP